MGVLAAARDVEAARGRAAHRNPVAKAAHFVKEAALHLASTAKMLPRVITQRHEGVFFPLHGKPALGVSKLPFKMELVDAPNAGTNRALLLRSNQPGSQNLRDLRNWAAERNIRPNEIAVLNLRLENNEEASEVRKLGMRPIHVAILDGNPPYFARQGVRIVNTVLDRRYKLVLVHCRMGIGRTGWAVSAIRQLLDGYSAKKAETEMRAHGGNSPFQIWAAKHFAEQVRKGKIDL